ncbi:membrane aminopeptidase H11-4 [Cavenderia fasciculata]|uniref:Membrane aminopeptidase H11-4 n=1 Tax=Cavenderia fasciculata TaxID=261658 RepID=F4PLV7_CACFS|nr:membrane aminopeptidase H11-4 [Cavenderia fasciculata]EGG23511.1 membrane aminopeptidase H11-4 [Cavenderia fasciculata]|eukprot:XP_004361362.1 membrane aminopeptidase H11-4 [Cavenderia fasciculata]
MRNLQHIQLKEIDDDDEDFERDGDDIKPRKKTYKLNEDVDDEDRYVRGGGSGKMHIGKLSSLWHTMTATNFRKSVLLLFSILCILAVTITLSFTTRHSDLKIPSIALYSDIRLPTWIKPIHYLVYMKADIQNLISSGTVVATLNISQSHNFIVVHGEDLNLTSAHINAIDSVDTSYPTSYNYPSSSLQSTSITYDANNTYYIIEFSDELSKNIKGGNQFFNLYLSFNSTLSDNKLSGLYLSKYTDPDGKERLVANTQFEPSDAREAFPCFDEPIMKANWTIWLDGDSGYQTLSNMPMKSAEPVSGSDRNLFKFDTSPPMSTYLVAMIFHQFEKVENTVLVNGRNVTVRVWAQSALMDSTAYPLQIASDSLTYYTKYFNIDYPISKMDLVGIPDFAAGAMELWGCITFREVDLFYNPKTSTMDNKQRVSEVIAHEIAHQWFGDLVTMAWWNDLWLNEGFATFMSYKCLAAICPEFDSKNDYLTLIKQEGLEMDSKLSTHAISNNFTKVIDIEASFDSVTYNKGSSVLFMLESILQDGDTDYFQKGIQQYLTKFSYSNAQTFDLWASLYHALPDDIQKTINVSKIMEKWVKTPGYPYLKVGNASPTQLQVSQHRFLDDLTSNVSTTQLWDIPISIQDGCSISNSFKIFSSKNEIIDYNPNCNFTIFNYNGTIFNRILYDEPLFKNITNQLNSQDNEINQQAMITFFDDSFSFIKNGLLNTSKTLEIARILSDRNITNPTMWKTVMGGLDFINHRMRLQECYPFFVKFGGDLLNNALAVVDVYNIPANETYMQTITRKTLIRYGNSYSKDDVIEYLRNYWLENKSQPENIDPNIRATLYASIISHGGNNILDQEYKWVLSRYLDPNTKMNERIDAMGALASARQPYLIQKTLNLLYNKQFRTQDIGSIFRQLSINQYAYLTTWEWMKNNYDFLLNDLKVQPSTLASYYKFFSEFFDQVSDYEDFEKFMSDKKDVFPVRTIQLALDQIQNNIDWIESNSQDICYWLYQNVQVQQDGIVISGKIGI